MALEKKSNHRSDPGVWWAGSVFVLSCPDRLRRLSSSDTDHHEIRSVHEDCRLQHVCGWSAWL